MIEKELELKHSNPRAYYCTKCGNVRMLRKLSKIKDGKEGHYCFICKSWVEYVGVD